MIKPPPRRDVELRPDLHVHSTFSDGLYTPTALCAKARAAGVTHLSLCDHDTLDGICAMANAIAQSNADADQSPMAFLPGVEISTGEHGRIHILGYGTSLEKHAVQTLMKDSQAKRTNRFKEMLKKLAENGIELPQELLPPLDGSISPGRAHLARALIAMGTVNTVEQAFARFLGEGRLCYVPYRHMSATEAVSFLRNSHCIPVLAHPSRLSMSEEARFAFIRSLADAGLMGVEVFHPSASHRDIRGLEPFVRKAGLLVSGGSDFHGDAGAHAGLGDLSAKWTTASHDIHALYSALTDV